MTIVEMHRDDTGETCASCGSEIFVSDLGTEEVVFECDCGPAAAAA